MAQPPVVKFLDFGQYKYELTKREKEAKRKQRSVTFKEVRLSPKIGVGDFDTKVHRAIEFLEDGDRIKVTVRFRGRELTHPEIGRNLITRFVDRVKDHGVAERTPLLEGKSMHITMASTHKPKSHDAPDRKHAVDEVPADALAIPAEAEEGTEAASGRGPGRDRQHRPRPRPRPQRRSRLRPRPRPRRPRPRPRPPTQHQPRPRPTGRRRRNQRPRRPPRRPRPRHPPRPEANRSRCPSRCRTGE